jgi:hypothetical protein
MFAIVGRVFTCMIFAVLLEVVSVAAPVEKILFTGTDEYLQLQLMCMNPDGTGMPRMGPTCWVVLRQMYALAKAQTYPSTHLESYSPPPSSRSYTDIY